MAARNDYLTEYVGDMTFEEVLNSSGSDSKEEFLHRLMERGHFGPLEHVHVVFVIEGLSRVCMAQMTRHRHASFDVQSLRYTTPGEDEQIGINNIEEYVKVPPALDTEEERANFLSRCAQLFDQYKRMLGREIPAEEARFLLPLSTKVNMVVSMNARSLLHVLDMRLKADVQGETRNVAENLLECGKNWFPIAFNYYEEELSPRRNQLAP